VTDRPRWRDTHDFDPPLRADADVYRRRILVEQLDDSTVRSVLEDDFHHFEVTLVHDGTQVVQVTNESHRYPWSTCPAAAPNLALLVGARLSPRFTHAARAANAQRNCTHQFDAAAHAFTAAATGRTFRQYDCEIAALITAGAEPRPNRVYVDGCLMHVWHVVPGQGPEELPTPFDGAPWRGGFMRWADEHLEPDAAEIAIVLRRACDIGMGRNMPLDAIPVASELLATMSGVCYTMQPEVAPHGVRNVGSIRDFAAAPAALGCDATHDRVAVIRD
jgi:Protein of unknown function (DUF2889)